ncbi:MAG: hydrogenase/urease maturation nickel metallochaperone HypA [Acidilobaceae archaeon]|nr:hydrogenase/urease maturation nickel metallochaperone HypA [Acidilobaceae archaeon]MCX8166065.1 hydrogenase/urease maturation nickel metallochaperone HypA [Acidilobaceae archaeon]MDW7974708.1 hydrogenase/urease maturation nickel metallochaperone HypA [Sulfolobales archaeon]
MHELALAEAIVSALVSEVAKGQRVNKVVVLLGELQNLDREAMEQYLEAGLKEANLNVRMEIKQEEASFRCRRCGASWRLSEARISPEEREAIHYLPEAVYAYVRCPSCASHDYEVVSGRGARVLLEE